MVFNKQGFSIDLKTNENEIFIILKATEKLRAIVISGV